MYPGEPPAAKQRRIEVDLGTTGVSSQLPGTPQLDLDLDMQFTSTAVEQRPSLAARNSWRRQTRTPLRPPASEAGGNQNTGNGEQHHRPAMPALPYAPMPASPVWGTFSSPCPVKTPGKRVDSHTAFGESFNKERCIPDSGLFLGASFRAGWGPNGVFCSQTSKAGGSAAQVALRKVLIGSEVVHDAASEERRVLLRRRLKDLLRVHYDNSLPDNGREGNGITAPRWRLQCSRSGGGLRELTHRFIKLSNDQAAAVSDIYENFRSIYSLFYLQICVGFCGVLFVYR